MTKQNFEQRYAAMNEKDRNTIMAAVYKMGAKAHSSLFSVGGMKATSPVKC
jgi:hypothetical protein